MKILITGEHENLPSVLPNGENIHWIQLPVLKYEKIPLTDDAMNKALGVSPDWIIFSSPRAIEFWGMHLLEHALELPVETRVACIGKRTAVFAERDGMNPDFFPEQPGTEGFLEEFEVPLKAKILLPVAESGRPTLAESLSKKGATVTVLPIYRSVAMENIPSAPVADRHLFTSPSSFDAFSRKNSVSKDAKVIAMGQWTQLHLQKKGFSNVAILPEGDFQRIGEVI